MADDAELENRLRATLAASRELGAEYDPAMVDQVRRLVVEHHLQVRRPEPGPVVRPGARRRGHLRRPLPIASLVLAVPLSAIAAALEHLPGLVVAWGGIVLVNVADALARRREHYLD